LIGHPRPLADEARAVRIAPETGRSSCPDIIPPASAASLSDLAAMAASSLRFAPGIARYLPRRLAKKSVRDLELTGPVVALTYRATVDVPARFRNSKAVGAVFGLTPSRYQSGESDRIGRISRCGDEMTRMMLYEAAQSMLAHSAKWSWLKAWAMKIARHRGMKKAIVALARRLAVIMHRIWVDGAEFRWTRESPQRENRTGCPISAGHSYLCRKRAIRPLSGVVCCRSPMLLAQSKSSRWSFVGTVFQRISTAAPRHFKICSSSSARAAWLS
jgi:hypothetical protein